MRLAVSLYIFSFGLIFGVLVEVDQVAAQSETGYEDPTPQMYRLKYRASELDTSVQSHPEIGFSIDGKDGKPADWEHASVDTRVRARGELVIWLMNHNQDLFDRLNSYGLHAIQVSYANQWFPICCQETPISETCHGDIRLEAATGEDFSNDVTIPKPDSIMERARQLVVHLAKENPQARWGEFLDGKTQSLRWDRVILAGSSHGSTTATRFSKHQKVARVVALCGPRDQFQTWQSLPSATPAKRVFAFSHVLDDGWKGDHYCRSWELLGLHQFGPIINVDKVSPPYGNSRRLITDADVGGNANRAHSSVTPGKAAAKAKTGKGYLHEDVWRYLFTHPVDQVGDPSATDDGCTKVHSQAKK
jgi:hypothetical protein